MSNSVSASPSEAPANSVAVHCILCQAAIPQASAYRLCAHTFICEPCANNLPEDSGATTYMHRDPRNLQCR